MDWQVLVYTLAAKGHFMKKEPKLLLINIENEPAHISPLLGFACIAAYLKKELNYGNIKQLNIVYTEENIEEKILNEKPDIVGFRTITAHVTLINKLSKCLKEKYGIPIIYGGPHITPIPRDLPDFVDIAVAGEGEYTITELMYLFLKNGFFPAEELEKIRGISFTKAGKVCFTGYREYISDLDALPTPDFSICDKECFTPRVRWLFLDTPVFGIPYARSRGCNNRCCFSQSCRFEGPRRVQSIEKTFYDLKNIWEKYKFEVVAFNDSIFSDNSEDLKNFYGALEKSGCLHKWFLYLMFFAKDFDEETAKILSNMLAYRVYFGLDGCAENTLRILKCNRVSIEDHRRVTRLAEKYKLRLDTGFMIGAPGETEQDLIDTENFIRNEYLNYVQINHTVPMPGTPLWSYAKRKGLIAEPIDWDVVEPKPHIPDEKLIYLNPGLDKNIYLKYNERLNRLAEQKRKQEKLLFKEGFQKDLALIQRRKCC